MAVTSGAVYVLCILGVLWLDRGVIAGMAHANVRMVVDAHLFLAAVAVVWVLGFERYNPLLVIGLILDLVILRWDRMGLGGSLIVALATVSCLYATYRNVVNARNDKEQPHGI